MSNNAEWAMKAAKEICSQNGFGGHSIRQRAYQEVAAIIQRHAPSDDRLRKAAEALIRRESVYSSHSPEFFALNAALHETPTPPPPNERLVRAADVCATWLQACLNHPKLWTDGDQFAAATESLEELRAALAEKEGR